MTASPDADVEHFYYKPDLTVDPPIDLTSTSLFKAKRTKDEDVTLDGGGNIVVVSRDVTVISAEYAKDQVCYDYDDLKRAVKAFAKTAKDKKAKLNGEVIVFANGSKYFRLKVTDNVVKVEAAVLGWPTGGTAPMHDDW